jgi:hypothetical protein
VADSSDYYSFEKALEELNMKEADLKKLVSENEIRAFRDGADIKFKRADVERLKTKTGGGKADASAETLADDLIFDEDEDLDLSDDEPGMATEKISSGDSLETLGSGRSSMMDEEDDEEVLESESGMRRSTGRATRIREAQATGSTPQPLMLALLIVTTVVLFYGVFILINNSRSIDTGLTEGFTGFVESMFGDQ